MSARPQYYVSIEEKPSGARKGERKIQSHRTEGNQAHIDERFAEVMK